MWKSRSKVLTALIVMILLIIACYSPLNYIMDPNIGYEPTEISQAEKSETQWAIMLGAVHQEDIGEVTEPTITPEPTATTTSDIVVSEIQPDEGLHPREGTCAWVLTADSDGYPSGEVKEGMRVGAGDIQTSLRTYFSHGKSECGEQVFETYHAWYLDQVYHPGETVNFSVVFAWQNNGTADCASLAMAGGSTALSVGGLQIKAQNSSINIQTDPQGELSDSDTWVVPEGAAGDTLTITQNVSTGIYGKNIRWRYEYICNP